MANVYVRSGAGGAGTGADWANAYTTLNAALTAKAAGDSFWVSEDHAESTAGAVAHTSPGISSNPCFIYCVDHAGTVPPVSADLRTTATVATTGTGTLSFAGGTTYCYGISFNCGTGTGVGAAITVASASTSRWMFNSCALNKLGTTASAAAILLGTATANVGSKIVLQNTTLKFGALGDGITVRGASIIWRNTATAIQGATLPTTLFAGNTVHSEVLVEGVDLSALGSGKTLVAAIVPTGTFTFKDCKLGSSVTVAATPSNSGPSIIVIRSDSSGNNYRTEKYDYAGTQTVETTIVRTGGASDGTTPISWKLVTTANSKWVLPLEAIPIAIWNDTVGSAITVTLYGIWDGGAVPNNDDIWMDVEYLGASANPQGSFISASKADNLAAGSALTTDTSTWGGSTTKFKMAVTFTPQQKGAIYVYVKAAKASSTFYIDPKPVLS